MPLSPYITNISREKLKKMGKIPFRFISSNYLIVTLMHIFQFSQSVSHPPPRHRLHSVLLLFCMFYYLGLVWLLSNVAFLFLARFYYLLQIRLNRKREKNDKTTKKLRGFFSFSSEAVQTPHMYENCVCRNKRTQWMRRHPKKCDSCVGKNFYCVALSSAMKPICALIWVGFSRVQPSLYPSNNGNDNVTLS